MDDVTYVEFMNDSKVPVKTGLGKVVWECAQAADELGKRLPELRCGRRTATSSEAANEGFASFIKAVAEPESPDLTIEKLVGIFDVLKPHLVDIYEITMRETDQISDAPTIEILETIVRKSQRHIAWGQEVLGRLCENDALRERRAKRAKELSSLLAQSGGVTGTLEADRSQLN